MPGGGRQTQQSRPRAVSAGAVRTRGRGGGRARGGQEQRWCSWSVRLWESQCGPREQRGRCSASGSRLAGSAGRQRRASARQAVGQQQHRRQVTRRERGGECSAAVARRRSGRGRGRREKLAPRRRPSVLIARAASPRPQVPIERQLELASRGLGTTAPCSRGRRRVEPLLEWRRWAPTCAAAQRTAPATRRRRRWLTVGSHITTRAEGDRCMRPSGGCHCIRGVAVEFATAWARCGE